MSDIEKAETSQQPQYREVHHEKPAPKPSGIANPATLGLFSFASTTFLLSMYNASVRNIATPNVVVGMAIFTGGLGQFMAGMWEFPRGNALGATAFTSYGAFWMSYATILIPGSGIVAAYGTNLNELNQALGMYLLTWWLVTLLFLVAALRTSVAFISLLVMLDLTFILLAAGAFTGHVVLNKAGGILGVITAFIAYYLGLSDLLTPGSNFFTLPVGVIKRD